MFMKNIKVLFLIFIIMFGLNSLTPMMYGDDYVYAFVWPGQSMYIPLPETVERISSFRDIIYSQWSHYLTGNGRLPAHMLVQFFVWQHKLLFNIFNSAVFVLLVLEIYWISNKGIVSFKNLQIPTMLGIFFSLWAFTVNFGGVFLWISGACNYLWMTTLLLSLGILYVRKYFLMEIIIIQKNFVKYLIFVWGVAVGWTNENTICWFIIVLGLWLIKRRKEFVLETWMWYGLAGLCIGYVLLISAPGNAVRAGSYANESLKIWSWQFMRSKLITFGLVEFFEVFFWFFILTSWGKIKRGRINDSVVQQLNLVKLFCVLNLLSNSIMLLTPEFPARSGFASLVFLLIASTILTRIQSTFHIELIDVYAKKFLILIAGCYFLITFCATYAGMYSTYQYDRHVLKIIQQYKSINLNTDLEIPAPPNHSEILLAASGYHLVHPELAKDDKNWINVAYARYHKLKSIRIKN